jgi:hypothetical protein
MAAKLPFCEENKCPSTISTDCEWWVYGIFGSIYDNHPTLV